MDYLLVNLEKHNSARAWKEKKIQTRSDIRRISLYTHAREGAFTYIPYTLEPVGAHRETWFPSPSQVPFFVLLTVPTSHAAAPEIAEMSGRFEIEIAEIASNKFFDLRSWSRVFVLKRSWPKISNLILERLLSGRPGDPHHRLYKAHT
jgi:hypothetical protein